MSDYYEDDELGALRQRYDALVYSLMDLTPGGSEYHNSPQRCFDWIRDRLAVTGKIAKERNQLRGQVADLLAAWSEFKDVWNFEHSEEEGASIEYRNYLRDVFGAVIEGIDEAIAKARGEGE